MGKGPLNAELLTELLAQFLLLLLMRLKLVPQFEKEKCNNI